MMIFVNLVPMGIIQLYDSFQNGYWHAREPELLTQSAVRIVEWLRMPGDIVFIVAGILPVVYLAVRMFRERNRFGVTTRAEAEPFVQ
jgi:nitric oxide reductase subunit B